MLVLYFQHEITTKTLALNDISYCHRIHIFDILIPLLFCRPCLLKESLYVLSSQNPEEKQAFKEEAKENWETLLVCRAKEMKPGNKLYPLSYILIYIISRIKCA